MRRYAIVSTALSVAALVVALAVPVRAQDTDKPPVLTPTATPTEPTAAPAHDATAPAATPEAPVKAAESSPPPTPAPPPIVTAAPEPAKPAPEATDKAEPPATVAAPAPTPAPAPEPAKPTVASEAAPTPDKLEAPPQVAAPTAPAPSGLDIAAAVQKLGPRSGPDKRDTDAIVAVYKARNDAPLWTGDAGRTPAAKAMLAEMARAGDYGLEPAPILNGIKEGPAQGAAPDVLAAEEVRIALAILRYARHARGGRIDPGSLTKFIDRQPRLYDPASVLEQIASANDPAAYLRQLHPQHAQFEKLRQKYLTMRKSNVQAANLAPVPDGPRIQPGATHPHVALVRARLGIAAPKPDGSAPANDNLYDQGLVKAVQDFQIARGLKPADGSIGNGTRQALNTVAQGNPKKVLANMEQWRWMPDNLGSFYVWVNIPEYTLRVVSNGQVIHSERVVVGKTDTQTPVFSDEMEQVIFHPFWGVPDGIKSNEIQPALARGQYAVLAKHNLRIASGNRDIDPASVDWRTADLRRFHVYQPPGNDNVLGVVKFRFPNKHDVYMHDTPTKGLFNTSVRTYSHGCMRVQNPVRLAEIVLAEDKKMATDKVRSLAAVGAPANNQINLTRKIPVHVTYFTASVEDDGKARYFPDVYGHENRINLALEGKAHLIAKVNEPKGPVRAEPVASLFEAAQKSGPRDWVRNAFTNN
ncbi:MAG: murein L,D-transpeptidase [Hyphomicrobiaceae bacterium]